MKYKKSDFRKVTWAEYTEVLEMLYKKVDRLLKKDKIEIDAVVPIIRGGGIPGIFLAYKLKILNIYPIQFKYLVRNKKTTLNKLNKFTPNKDIKTVLVVENNLCFGDTTQAVIKEIRGKIPNVKIILAATYADLIGLEKIKIDKIVYGKLTNETKSLSEKEAKAKNIVNKLALFPWENIDEELAIMNGKEYKFRYNHE